MKSQHAACAVQRDLWPCVVCNGIWLSYVNDFNLPPLYSEPNIAVLVHCPRCNESLKTKKSPTLTESAADKKISPQETEKHFFFSHLCFPCLYLRYFIAPCNLNPPHGYKTTAQWERGSTEPGLGPSRD